MPGSNAVRYITEQHIDGEWTMYCDDEECMLASYGMPMGAAETKFEIIQQLVEHHDKFHADRVGQYERT